MDYGGPSRSAAMAGGMQQNQMLKYPVQILHDVVTDLSHGIH